MAAVVEGGQRQRGFTLVELMVTVVIIFAVAAIAVPSYLNYLSTGRHKAIMDKVAAFQLFEDAYHTDNSTYFAGSYAPGGTNDFAAPLGYQVRNDIDGISFTVQAGSCGNIAKCYSITATNTQGEQGTWEAGTWTWSK